MGFFGGDLTTHLLKLGFVDERTVGRALSEITGAPFASEPRLRILPPAAFNALPRKFVARHRVCPFAVKGRTLRVAMENPRDAVTVAAIRSASGMEVEAWVTSEHRLDLALERHYGVRSEGRKGVSVRPASSRARPRGQAPRPGIGPAAGGKESDDSGPELGLDGLPLDAELTFDDHLAAGWATLAPGEDGTGSDSRSADGEKAVSLSSLDDRLSDAADTGEVAEAILDLCSTVVHRCALFSVGREGYRCLAGRGRGLGDGRVRDVEIPAGTDTIFDVTLDSGRLHFGPVAPTPPNREIYTLLGGRLPDMAVLIPVVVKGRRVALLYLDNDGDSRPIPDVLLVRRIAAKAGLALEILLLKRKLREI
jgi:hypothetical protein